MVIIRKYTSRIVKTLVVALGVANIANAEEIKPKNIVKESSINLTQIQSNQFPAIKVSFPDIKEGDISTHLVDNFNLTGHQKLVAIEFLNFLKKHNALDLRKYSSLSLPEQRSQLVADLGLLFDRKGSELFHDNSKKLAWLKSQPAVLDDLYENLIPKCYFDSQEITPIPQAKPGEKVAIIMLAGHVSRYPVRLRILQDAVNSYRKKMYDVEIIVISGARAMGSTELATTNLDSPNISNENNWWGSKASEIAEATGIKISHVKHLSSLDRSLGGERATTEDNAILLSNYLKKNSKLRGAKLVVAVEHPFGDRMTYTNNFFLKMNGIENDIELYQAPLVSSELMPMIAARSDMFTFAILNSMYRIFQNVIMLEKNATLLSNSFKP